MISPTVTALALIFLGIPSGTWACRVLTPHAAEAPVQIASPLKRVTALCVLAALLLGLLYLASALRHMLGIPEIPAG